MKSNQALVQIPIKDWFAALRAFYRMKYAVNPRAGVFSCEAAAQFPMGWLKAFETGTWDEEGVYGDNFREFFGLDKVKGKS